jgi:hypothetical protein
MWSGANNIGWWVEREVSFCIPVKWYHDGELISVAMVAPFVYANNGRAVITDREINGRPSVHATIDSPEDSWLTSSGPSQGRRFLHMDTEAFPALHLGQKRERRTLLEIDEHEVLRNNDDIGWRVVASSWGEKLIDELKRKTKEHLDRPDAVEDVKALALELLAHEAPINWINLKQYRDASDTERACYQAAVHVRRSITHVHDIREIEQNIHVRVHRLPGHPIVETLGLEVKSVDSGGGKVIETLQPIRPFWMRVAIREELGTTAAWRTTDARWHLTHPWFAASGSQGVSPPYFRHAGETRVSAWLGKSPRLRERLRDHSAEWLHEAVAAELTRLRQWAQQTIFDGDGDWRDRLAPSEHADLARLGVMASVEAYCSNVPLERQLALVLAVQRARAPIGPMSATFPWESAETRLQRLTYAQAHTAVAALDEVQLVVESILSGEWGNWANPRRCRNLPPKPEQCVPSNSLYGGSWVLSKNAKDFMEEHGLAVTEDGSSWYLASAEPPAAQQ